MSLDGAVEILEMGGGVPIWMILAIPKAAGT
jgi:hypothetical protein